MLRIVWRIGVGICGLSVVAGTVGGAIDYLQHRGLYTLFVLYASGMTSLLFCRAAYAWVRPLPSSVYEISMSALQMVVVAVSVEFRVTPDGWDAPPIEHVILAAMNMILVLEYVLALARQREERKGVRNL